MSQDPTLEPAASSADARRAVAALFQPFSPAYVEDPARAFYLPAHAQAPVAYCEAFDAWLVVGHAEVTQVLREPNLFSSTKNLEPSGPIPEAAMEELRQGIFPLPPALFNNDPPAHTRARALFSKAFTPARIAALEPAMRAVSEELVRALPRTGGIADLMHDLAFPFPMRISAALVGIPAEDIFQLKAWQDGWFQLYSPEPDVEAKTAAAHGFVLYQRYLADLIEQRRAEPADDLLTALIQARVEGEQPLSVEEIVSHLIVLFFAGYETTASLIGSLTLRLLERPGLWEAVGQDPGLLAAAIEETLRLDAPVQMEPRHTTADAVVGGVQIPAGARVYVFFGGASYDPKVFPDPLRFDLARERSPQARHLAFGWGIHTCIGGPLARTEARIAVEGLRAAYPRLRLAEGARPSYTPSLMFRTPAAVPVVLDPGT